MGSNARNWLQRLVVVVLLVGGVLLGVPAVTADAGTPVAVESAADSSSTTLVMAELGEDVTDQDQSEQESSDETTGDGHDETATDWIPIVLVLLTSIGAVAVVPLVKSNT